MRTLPMLGLTLLLVHFTLGALSLAAARGGVRLRSVRLWGWGMMIYAGGLLVLMLESLLGAPLTHVTGALLIAASTVPLV